MANCDCVTDIEVNILAGPQGWTAIYSAAVVGGKNVIYLADYIGGTGEKPTDYIGQYLKIGGGFTTDINEAIDFKGDKGDKPAHDWNGTSLSFENPDGTTGGYVDLKGEKGDKGDTGDLNAFSFDIVNNDLIFYYPDPNNSNVSFEIDNSGNLILKVA